MIDETSCDPCFCMADKDNMAAKVAFGVVKPYSCNYDAQAWRYFGSRECRSQTRVSLLKHCSILFKGASIKDVYAKVWDFLTPSPWLLLSIIKITQPPLLRMHLHDPSPPRMRTYFMDAPLRHRDLFQMSVEPRGG